MPDFAHPLVLWFGLLVAPVVLLVFRLRNRKMREMIAAYGNLETIRSFSRVEGLGTSRALGWIVFSSLLVVALANPQVTKLTSVRTGTLRMVAVMDQSISMAAEPYRADLGSVAKPGSNGTSTEMAGQILVDKVLPMAQGNKAGLVFYTGSAFPQAEITHDLGAITWMIEHWLKKLNPGGGSDIAIGIIEAIKMFDRDDQWQGTTAEGDRVILLFSDGGFTGDPDALATVLQYIKTQKIFLVVIGLGPDQAMTVPLYKGTVMTGVYQEDGGAVTTTRIDEKVLRDIATAGGGQYLRMAPGGFKNGVKLPIDWQAHLTRRNLEMRLETVYQFPLAAALLLLVLLVFSSGSESLFRACAMAMYLKGKDKHA